MKYLDDPAAFFRDFRPAEGIRLRDGIHERERCPPLAPFRRMLFDSPIRTAWPENDLVPFKSFRDERKPSRAILLFAPGWGRPSQSFEERWCFSLQKMGVDAGLLTVPYHQARTPRGSFSGEFWISANTFWTIANFRHFTAEIRLLLQYMRQHYEYVGLLGMSSGGFQAGLAANCEPVDFFFPLITGGNVGGIAWHGNITRYLRQDLERKGVDEVALSRVWSITDECVLARHCKAKYIKQYISLYDNTIPTRYQVALWEALGKPHKMDLPCGHFGLWFPSRRVLKDIADVVNARIAMDSADAARVAVCI